MKPGYKTSEFWFTLASFIFSGLFLIGVIPDNDQKEDLIQNISHGVESVILIGAQLAIFLKYINERKSIKVEYEKTKQKQEDNDSKEIEDYVGVDKTYDHININTALLGELIQLPHIGTVLAKNIMKYRSQVGPFIDKEDILKVDGIGPNTYHDIKQYITV